MPYAWMWSSYQEASRSFAWNIWMEAANWQPVY